MHIIFRRIGCTLFMCDMYMCRLRHINDSVLSSLKMEGIRLLYFSVYCFPTPPQPALPHVLTLVSVAVNVPGVTSRYGTAYKVTRIYPRLRHINVNTPYKNCVYKLNCLPDDEPMTFETRRRRQK
jgi:hypothetical protein